MASSVVSIDHCTFRTNINIHSGLTSAQFACDTLLDTGCPCRSSAATPGSTWCDLARPRMPAKHKPHHDPGATLRGVVPLTDFHRCPFEHSVLAHRPTDCVISGLDVHRPLRGHGARRSPRPRQLDPVRRAALLPHLASAPER